MSSKWNAIHSTLAGLALAAAVSLVAAPAIRADDECQKRTSRADRELHKAVEHHGWNSPEAEHWRHELADARSYCWEHAHRWWDEDSHRWHDQRDWDDHDHDHDHDHH